MRLYINPNRGFSKILNFEQARHFGSKQAVQKQWSLSNVIQPVSQLVKI
jgi:hypothetical protein